MGITRINVKIRNPAEPDRVWEGPFLVDTGAIDCLVPRQHLEAIGLVPKGHRTYGLADGSSIRMDVTVGEIEFMDEIVGGTIVYGAANAEPLLGVTALESAGVEVDPHNQVLNKLPSVRLPGFKSSDLTTTKQFPAFGRLPPQVVTDIDPWVLKYELPSTLDFIARYADALLVEPLPPLKSVSVYYDAYADEPLLIAFHCEAPDEMSPEEQLDWEDVLSDREDCFDATLLPSEKRILCERLDLSYGAIAPHIMGDEPIWFQHIKRWPEHSL